MDLRLVLKYGVSHWVQSGVPARRRSASLVARERVDPAQREGAIEARLRDTLISAAQSIPAFHRLRGKIPDTGLREFLRETVPITTKEDLQRQRQAYYPNRGMVRPWWSVGKTSGTTGSPLEVFRSLDSIVWEQAVLFQHWGWAGLRPGERQVILRGDHVVPMDRREPPFWFHDVIGRKLFVSTRHISPGSASAMAEAISRFGAQRLRAYPSAAYELARLTMQLDLPIRFGSIVTSSEMLYPFQRETIERAFGGRVFNGYGMAERVIYAAECEQGRMHVNPEYGIVEILDRDGRPTDEEGFLVGTTLHNRAMPLLRYKLLDSARWDTRPCPCGRTFPVIRDLVGRVGDTLFDLDGAPVTPGVVTFAFKGTSAIRRAQVAQVAVDQWLVRLVPDDGYSERTAAELLGNFHRLVSARANVRIETVADIPNLPNGKFKWVSQECAGAGASPDGAK
jgi:phenylacetate-CoA ligase